ncbi:hypothetical protein COBT_003009, partial [Conglomerata obtusa]
ANRKLWSTYNFIANTDKFMQSTNLSKFLMNHYYINKTKKDVHTERFIIEFSEKNCYYERKNATIEPVYSIKKYIVDCSNEHFTNYLTTLSDKTLSKSRYNTENPDKKDIENMQIHKLKIVSNLDIIEFLFVINKSEQSYFLQNNSKFVYRVSIYYKKSKK